MPLDPQPAIQGSAPSPTQGSAGSPRQGSAGSPSTPGQNPPSSHVLDAIGAAAGLAQLLLPQYVAYIVLGAAIAKAAPALYHDALSLLQNREPTQEEKAALARKLHALAHPEAA